MDSLMRWQVSFLIQVLIYITVPWKTLDLRPNSTGTISLLFTPGFLSLCAIITFTK